MLAEFDFGPLGTLAIIFVGVIVFLVVQAAKAQDEKRGNLRQNARPVAMPRIAAPAQVRQPRFVPAAQQEPVEDLDSDEAEEVAQTLAPDFVEMSHAKSLVKPEVAVQTAKSWLNFRDANEVRRAFILKEVLGKPAAMRKR